jgi:hypothetical protein
VWAESKYICESGTMLAVCVLTFFCFEQELLRGGKKKLFAVFELYKLREKIALQKSESMPAR